MSKLTPRVRVSKRVGDIEMGVFEDGSTYLTERSLASLCGVDKSTLSEAAKQWEAGKRDGKFSKFLGSLGFFGPSLFMIVEDKGVMVNAYPEVVCMAFLEYYAFISDKKNATALNEYRVMARATLRLFIYEKIGYDPRNVTPDKWRQFHDRMEQNVVPHGYFSVFREMSTLVLNAIQSGLAVDDHTIPDISVGQHWSKHWVDQDIASKHGDRIKYEHNFPDYFPQARSNPQDAHAYPIVALGEFRQWLEDVYMPTMFPKYLDDKVKRGQLAAATASLILSGGNPTPKLPPKT